MDGNLLKSVLIGIPGGGSVRIRGYDQYGRPVEEIVDTSKSLAEMLRVTTGRDVPVYLIEVPKEE